MTFREVNVATEIVAKTNAPVDTIISKGEGKVSAKAIVMTLPTQIEPIKHDNLINKIFKNNLSKKIGYHNSRPFKRSI